MNEGDIIITNLKNVSTVRYNKEEIKKKIDEGGTRLPETWITDKKKG